MYRAHVALLAFSMAILGHVPTATADVPPPDLCFDEGASCNTALGNGGQAGTCQKAKCQRVAPPGEAGAGGDGIIVYDCLRCLVGRGGAGGSGGGSGGSTGGAPRGGAAGDASGGTSGAGGSVEGGSAGERGGGSAGQAGGGSGAVPQGGSAGSEMVGGDGGVTGVATGSCTCGIGRYGSDHLLALLMLLTGLFVIRWSGRRR